MGLNRLFGRESIDSMVDVRDKTNPGVRGVAGKDGSGEEEEEPEEKEGEEGSVLRATER